MSISLEQLSAQMRRGEQVPLRHTMQVVLTLSIPSILQQIVVTAVEYIDAAMVGHIGASATASIGIVSSSTWLMHGMLAGLYMSFAIQVAQYLGADRQDDARGVLRQSMIFNLVVGLAAAAFGIGISRFLPGWLGADPSLQADASAYFAIWSASLPFLMIMGTYSSMLRSSGDALTPGLISVLTCVLDVIFNFCLINPTREMVVFGRTMTVWGLGWGVPGAALGTALATAISGVLTLAILLLRDGPLCIRKPGSWHITKACLQNLWKVGAPLAAERAVLSSAQVLLVRIVSGLGTTAIAANSLGVSAESLCYMAGVGDGLDLGVGALGTNNHEVVDEHVLTRVGVDELGGLGVVHSALGGRDEHVNRGAGAHLLDKVAGRLKLRVGKGGTRLLGVELLNLGQSLLERVGGEHLQPDGLLERSLGRTRIGAGRLRRLVARAASKAKAGSGDSRKRDESAARNHIEHVQPFRALRPGTPPRALSCN